MSQPKRPPARRPDLDDNEILYEIWQQPSGHWTFQFSLTEEQQSAAFMKPGMASIYGGLNSYRRKRKEKVERKAQRMAELLAQYVCEQRERRRLERIRTKHTVEVKCS